MRTLAALLLLLAAAPPALSAVTAERASPSPSPGVVTADQLFSRRALRRARILIQMRLMQLHDERLECVRAALLRGLPESLRPDVPAPVRDTGAAAAAAAECERLLRF